MSFYERFSFSSLSIELIRPMLVKVLLYVLYGSIENIKGARAWEIGRVGGELGSMVLSRKRFILVYPLSYIRWDKMVIGF